MIKRLLYAVKSRFLTVFGNIRTSKYPPFLFYDDVAFAMDGQHIRSALETAKPGDIVLRGYDSYLDSAFISSSRKYSHAGIVVKNGKVVHATAPNVCEIDLIDFMHCDRIAIVRPRKYRAAAVKIAERFRNEKTPYDFAFTHGDASLYCFELASYCYPKIHIEKRKATAMFGLIRKSEPVYLSDSFFSSKDMDIVFEYNPRFNIDFRA